MSDELSQTGASRSRPRRERRPPKPLDARALEDMALAYVAKFATSAGKLSAYLRRKLRERGWASGDAELIGAEAVAAGEAAAAALCARFVELGYVDDAGFARMRADSLHRRGMGARRVEADLNAAGIAAPLRQSVQGGEDVARAAVLAFARRRRFGPYARDGGAAVRGDPALRHKQMAAFIRAGHGPGESRGLLMMETAAAAEAWAGEGEGGEDWSFEEE